MAWRSIPVTSKELSIDKTLRCGQSFRWKKSEEGVYSCAIHGRLISLRQDSTSLYYRAVLPHSSKSVIRSNGAPMTPKTDSDNVEREDLETEAFLRHYLNLEPNLEELYEMWAKNDKNFRKKAPKFAGIRILRQDAWESLVGFICSSNNNIARISQMMEKLCIHYGPSIASLDDITYHDMPPPTALTGSSVESHLRDLGFGYRAKYLHQTALAICEQSSDWLNSLRNSESPLLHQSPSPAGEMLPGGREGYRAAHEALLSLQGVGPKVADCVCLMGLGWGEAVPVDTHVWQIATRDYGFGKGKHRSLTKATYDAVGDCFRRLWGNEAGWAHSVLFTADLRAFAERTKEELKVEIVQNGVVKAVVKSEPVEATDVKEALGPAHLLPTPEDSPLPPRTGKCARREQPTPSKVLQETVVKVESPEVKRSLKRRIITEQPPRPLKRESPGNDAKRPALGRRRSQRVKGSSSR